MIRIEIMNGSGEVLARGSHEEECLLCFDHAWAPGDRIRIDAEGERFLRIGIDTLFSGCLVYLPEGSMTWTVPSGEGRLAYAPGAFDLPRHIVQARKPEAGALSACRDLALNPADLRGETDFYPHCTANVETRGESVFAARNVIDGLRFNTYHGEWPFESWGIGAREDAWCRIDFGREVTVERMALTLRADFPHGAWWVSGHVTASDGMDRSFELEKTGERQWISTGRRRIRWIQLERMQKSEDPSAFPSLRAWEVYGWDN